MVILSQLRASEGAQGQIYVVLMLKVAPYSLIQFTNDLYRSVRLDVILATFAWNFRSSAKFLKQEPQNLLLSAVMYQNMIILHYFLDFLKS